MLIRTTLIKKFFFVPDSFLIMYNAAKKNSDEKYADNSFYQALTTVFNTIKDWEGGRNERLNKNNNFQFCVFLIFCVFLSFFKFLSLHKYCTLHFVYKKLKT